MFKVFFGNGIVFAEMGVIKVLLLEDRADSIS